MKNEISEINSSWLLSKDNFVRVSQIREGEKTFGSSITTTFLLLRICSGVPGDGGIGVGRTFDLISCSCKRCRSGE